MAYWNAAGLAATRAVEGGAGGYTAHDPSSSASGAYSFLTATWQTYAPKAGVDINRYPYAYMAPPAAQDAVAAITPVSNWAGTWAGSSGANARNPAYIQSQPMTTDQLSAASGQFDIGGNTRNFTAPPGTPDNFVISDTPGSQSEHPLNPGDYSSDPNSSFTFNDPGTGGGTTSPSGTGSGTGAQAQPGAGTPVQVNLGPQTATDLQSWVNAPINAAEKWASAQFAQLQNWFGRGFLILIGIVIVGIALWKATGGPSPAEIVTAVK